MKQESTVDCGMRIDWDVPIEMDDGVVLRADVFRPLADGRYPVIMSHGPYGKGMAYQNNRAQQFQNMVDYDPAAFAGSSNRYQLWEVLDPEPWTRDGYVLVRVDSRGAGASPGRLDAWSPRETKDYYNCIEWAAGQPWCTGKVGLSGISYFAMNAWQVAALQPPHLAAMVVWEGAADWYRDVYRHGGIVSDFCGGPPFDGYPFDYYKELLIDVQHGMGSRGPRSWWRDDTVAGPDLPDEERARNRADMNADVLEHVLDDAHTRAMTPDLSKVITPFLSAANWGGQGLHGRGNFEGFMRAAATDKWLEVHGHDHFTHYYTRHGQGLQKRFFDHFLKGEDNGWDRQPRVILQVRSPGEVFLDRTEDAWPIPRTRFTPLYLDAADRSLAPAAPTSLASVAYDATGPGVTFLSQPISEDTEINGPVAATLFVSSSTQDADLFAVLRVFDPEGEEIVFQGSLDANSPVGQGWLRVSQRKLDPALSLPYRPYHAHDERQPLTPGEVYQVEVEIWPTCIVAPAGARVALSIRGNDYEYDGKRPQALGAGRPWPSNGCGPFTHLNPKDRPPEIFHNSVTIHTGPGRDAFLLLPIVPPKEADQ